MARRTVGRDRPSRSARASSFSKASPGLSDPGVDGGGELLGQLVVERDRARAVDQNRELYCHGLMLAESLIHVTTCKCQNKWLTAVVARFHSGRAAGTPPHLAPERSGTWAPSVWTSSGAS